MDQSEIDALVNQGTSKKKPKTDKKAPPKSSKPAKEKKQDLKSKKDDLKSKEEKQAVIKELDSIADVTERETNKVMDKLDQILAGADQQQKLLNALKEALGSHTEETVMEEFNKLQENVNNVRDSVFESMDLLQFQDITRQKLEKIVYHLKQIHDYIVDLLGIGDKEEKQQITFSKNIHKVGTVHDEKKEHADSIIAEFKKNDTPGK